MSSSKYILEICANSIQSVNAAVSAKADRIELCMNLENGGTTPSPALIEYAANLPIDIHVLIRPRSGDFDYNMDELELMIKNIHFCKKNNIQGIVSGALDTKANPNIKSLQKIIKEAYPMSFTFHRAFDMVRDPFLCMQQLIQLKVDRVLTSGLQKHAHKGTELIYKLNQKYGSKIKIMAGGGVNPDNIIEIASKTKINEFHTSASEVYFSKMNYKNPQISMGNSDTNEYENKFASEKLINKIKQQLDNYFYKKTS